MSRRTDIIVALVNHIAQFTEISGTRGIKFLHEINSFPSFYIHPQLETRTHVSHGVRLAVITCEMRAYVYSDTLNDVEQTARLIETAVQTFAKQHLNLADECRVTSIRTDEGIMSPYGLVDLTLEILYRIEQ
jgi:hypothetical protein